MELVNMKAVLAAAVVNLLVGFVWYNPKTLGNAWMKESNLTEEKLKGSNMALMFGLSFFFAFLMAFSLNAITIHQFHLNSIVMHQLDGTDEAAKSLAQTDVAAFMNKYGQEFRTYKHGALHGGLFGVFFVLPLIAINGLFERKSWKYILINSGYWIVCLTLMGAIICGWQN